MKLNKKCNSIFEYTYQTRVLLLFILLPKWDNITSKIADWTMCCWNKEYWISIQLFYRNILHCINSYIFLRYATSFFVTNKSHLMRIMRKNKNRKGNLTLHVIPWLFWRTEPSYHFCNACKRLQQWQRSTFWKLFLTTSLKNYMSSRIKVIFLSTVQKLSKNCQNINRSIFHFNIS